MSQCQGMTLVRRRCNRAARVGSRYCFQHQRECTDSTDPISLTPLRDDIIRIEAENGLVHCFNADTFKLYIESRIEHYPRIANPLTNDPIPKDQLDAIILRLRIDPRLFFRPRRRERREFDRTIHMTDEQVRQGYPDLHAVVIHRALGLDDDDWFVQSMIAAVASFNQGNIRLAYNNMHYLANM